MFTCAPKAQYNRHTSSNTFGKGSLRIRILSQTKDKRPKTIERKPSSSLSLRFTHGNSGRKKLIVYEMRNIPTGCCYIGQTCQQLGRHIQAVGTSALHRTYRWVYSSSRILFTFYDRYSLVTEQGVPSGKMSPPHWSPL